MRLPYTHILLSLVFLLTFPFFGVAQTAEIDSLKEKLKTTKEDTNRINLLNNLGRSFQLTAQFDSSLAVTKKALFLSQKLKFKNGEAKSYSIIGSHYIHLGRYSEALQNYFSSLKIRKEINDRSGLANTFANIGQIYVSQGNYPEALNQTFAALKIKEELGDKWGEAACLNNIGTVYSYQGNDAAALKSFFSALKIREEIADKPGMADSYGNIGILYANQKNYAEALKQYVIALKLEKEINRPDGVATSLEHIGNIYTNLYNFSYALDQHIASLKIREEINDTPGIASSCINIGFIYNNLNKSVKAKTWLIKGVDIAKKIGNLEILKHGYLGLTKADSAANNYESALQNYKLYILSRDSLVNEENTKKTVQTQMQYEFDKKESAAKAEQEKKDAVAAADVRRQKIILYSVSGFGVLLLLLATVIFRSLRINQRKNKIITEQKELVEKQKEIVEEKQKEILDSIHYAKRIQTALLPSEKYITRNLKN